MSYLCQKCKKKKKKGGGGGVTVFFSDIKRVESYPAWSTLFIVKNVEGESTEANDLRPYL